MLYLLLKGHGCNNVSTLCQYKVLHFSRDMGVMIHVNTVSVIDATTLEGHGCNDLSQHGVSRFVLDATNLEGQWCNDLSQHGVSTRCYNSHEGHGYNDLSKHGVSTRCYNS